MDQNREDVDEAIVSAGMRGWTRIRVPGALTDDCHGSVCASEVVGSVRRLYLRLMFTSVERQIKGMSCPRFSGRRYFSWIVARTQMIMFNGVED